jgi:cytochrome P450
MSATNGAGTPETAALPAPPPMPVHRTGPFDPPGEYARLRAERPVSRLRLPGGRIGWLVTRYQDVRAILADPRLSPPLVQVTPAAEPPVPEEELEVPAGTFSALDPPEHTRYRRLLSRYFTRKRVGELAPRIAQIADEHLVTMINSGCPADLVASFARPVPAAVTTEILGVPASSRACYMGWVLDMLAINADSARMRAAQKAIYDGLGELVAAKRGRPGDDIITNLLHSDARLSTAEVVNISALLLITGMDTTASMLGLGVFALLQHPDQLAAMRADESQLGAGIEELLRYLTIVQFGLTRTARADVEIGGRAIHAGETIIASLAAANRDPAVFSDPDRLDVRRGEIPHLAFGHGVHTCLGAQLARMELKTGLSALFRRLPSLRLAVPPEEVPMGHDRVFYGVHTLPVAWDR